MLFNPIDAIGSYNVPNGPHPAPMLLSPVSMWTRSVRSSRARPPKPLMYELHWYVDRRRQAKIGQKLERVWQLDPSQDTSFDVRQLEEPPLSDQGRKAQNAALAFPLPRRSSRVCATIPHRSARDQHIAVVAPKSA